MEFKKGDIVLVDLNPKKGEEIGKIRPAVVMSEDILNSELDVILVVPLSTKLVDKAYPYRIRAKKRENLEQDSDILIYHLRAVSKKRVIKKIAKLKDEEMDILKKAICEIL
ncbi:type II toxin-antitoxin system PemK/MazF family toxin [Nitrosophilus labii]|uniref:type II toxin-antitoxin system PemK/MazF family toxin n=1 Tax=Nitrosophilus labii TaxID=2706014 RepID=UPI001656D435|nr:type II toxin-antitoxin system PemK/MazF family toxin [Nitrosophilus labii]